MGELVASLVEDCGGDEHQQPGYAEGEMWSVVLEKDGSEQHRREGAEVDGQVEPAEDALSYALVAGAELIADVRRDAWLDPS